MVVSKITPLNAAQAAMIVNVQEVGSNVVIDYSGDIGPTGMTYFGKLALPFFGVQPRQGSIFAMPASFDHYDLAGQSATIHGAGDFASATSTTGDAFGLSSFHDLGVPVGYTFGTPISGSMTFVGASLFSLGYTPGVHTIALPNDTVTTNVIAAAVPLPAAAPMLLGALALTGFMARRRKG